MDNDFQTFTFTFTDYDGVQSTLTRKSSDGFFWPDVIKDVCRVIERQFGYEVIEDVSVKGKQLNRYENPHYFVPKWVDTEEENFPEAKSGLTD
jgi:hypothetical protein